MRKYCTPQDFKDAELILRSLCVETDCFIDGKIIRARYLVAIDDDPTSAFYTAYVYHLIYQTYAYHPFVLCVGGKGPLSKYTNERDESEGDKQRRVCIALGVQPSDIRVLDKGTNTGENLLDIVLSVSSSPGRIIMCLTGRLSLRLRQTLLYLDRQYADRLDKQAFDEIMRQGVYYYVPEESVDDQMQLYNCKGLAGGLLLLSEVASIYNRIRRYSGTLQAPLDFEVPREVIEASGHLEAKYPLKNGKLGFTYVWQFIEAWSSVKWFKRQIQVDLSRAIKFNQRQLMEEFDFLGKTQYGLYLKRSLA